MKRRLFILLMLLTLIQVASLAVPQLISFSARLNDADGNPLRGEKTVTVRLYPGLEASLTPLWTEAHSNVALNRGVCNVLLGSVVPLPADLEQHAELYLSVQVEGETDAVRVPLTSQVFALKSGYAEHAGALANTGNIRLSELGGTLKVCQLPNTVFQHCSDI